MNRQAEWVARAVGGQMIGPDVTVTGPVVTDSREATAGSLYVARRGENADGHDFIASARDNGAVAALVEREIPQAGLTQIVTPESTEALGVLAHAHLEDLRQAGPLDVIAVTGSAGKTTTKDLLAALMATDGPTVAPKLSFNNEVGLPLTVLKTDEHTRHLVLEMGASGPGHLRMLTGIAAPDVAIELMVGTAHLGGFGSREATASAKAELIKGMKPDGTAVLNADDDYVAAMAQRAPGRIIGFTTRTQYPQFTDTWIRAENITIDADERAAFDLITPEGRAHVHLTLVGAHHVHNALAAAAGAYACGVDTQTIAQVLTASGPSSPHRMDIETVTLDEGRTIILIDDAYNANPDSMRAALTALKHLGAQRNARTVAVLGAMLELGEQSEALHRDVAQMALDAGVSHIFTWSADAQPLASHAQAKTDSGTEVTYSEDWNETLGELTSAVRDGDIVLVKGSYGSHAWQIAATLMESGCSR